MSALLQKMMSHLSDDDRTVFAGLAERLSKVNGDVEQLSDDDLQLISDMEQKYGDQIRTSHESSLADNKVQEDSILDTPFAQHVRQILARDLVNEIPMEEDAVKFVFDNKWLPIDCQDDDLVADLFQRFEDDIKLCNRWREDLVTVEEDKKMALGLAWFMVIYKLNERLNQ